MKPLLLATGIFLLLLSCSNPLSEDEDHSERIFEEIENQYNSFLKLNIEQNKNSEIYFCNGYFAGVNWNMFILSGHKKFKELATESLSIINQNYQDSLAWCKGDQLMAGLAMGIKITHNEAYKKHLIEAVRTMTHQFNPETGWFYPDGDSQNHASYNFGFESIMKLESLFYAARLTADPVYHNIAIKHAEVVLDSYFEDGAKTDLPLEMMEVPARNEFTQLQTDALFQTDEFKLNSLIVYSCALLFRETGERKYQNIAESVVEHISEQLNYSVTKASVADIGHFITDHNVDITSLAVLTSALYDLSLLNDNKDFYLDKANQFISVLSTKTYFEYKNRPDPALMLEEKNEIHEDLYREDSLFIKEYFFLEALNKRQKLKEIIS